jgi:hypothetical protein
MAPFVKCMTDERRAGGMASIRAPSLALSPPSLFSQTIGYNGDSYLDTAARQLRILTGFHATSVVSRAQLSV